MALSVNSWHLALHSWENSFALDSPQKNNSKKCFATFGRMATSMVRKIRNVIFEQIRGATLLALITHPTESLHPHPHTPYPPYPPPSWRILTSPPTPPDPPSWLILPPLGWVRVGKHKARGEGREGWVGWGKYKPRRGGVRRGGCLGGGVGGYVATNTYYKNAKGHPRSLKGH